MAKKFAGDRRSKRRDSDVDARDSDERENGSGGDPPATKKGNEGFSATKSDRSLPLFPCFFVQNLNH